MNKSALKKFATEARKELLERVKLQARKLGITEEYIKEITVESSDAIYIEGYQLSDIEKIQRKKLIERIEKIGFNQVIEETAYSWFNRFVALRFMEVNDYLPTRTRVLSSLNPNNMEPDMFKDVLSLDLEIDKEYVYELKVNNKTDELFKYLIKLHCNDLNRYMPFMFETIEDYKEILFPEGLLGRDSFVRKMTNIEEIPEKDWRNVEVIGWLYQYYISEEKDRVFSEKKKYKKEEIPYATQLFTPDWIVKYMVQNSLGKYWLEAHPEQMDLKENWEFYLEPVDQFNIDKSTFKNVKVEDIKCFDPAMGSGHILVYMFDLLYEIYKKNGYMEREIPRLIIEHNLYGLDIDNRAYQLACFSVVMKALQYNRRFLRMIEKNGITLNLAAIQESNSITEEVIAYIAKEEKGSNYEIVKKFVEQFYNAKIFGSLIQVNNEQFEFLQHRLLEIQSESLDDIFQASMKETVLNILPNLLKQTYIMMQEYDIVIMNPPYMGLANMNKELAEFLKQHYPNSKSDLFAAFMEVDFYLKPNGFYAAINQHSWMFLSSYEALREKIIGEKFIDSMLHLGPRTFEEIGGEVVQSTAFVLRNSLVHGEKGIYVRLIEERSPEEKRNTTVQIVKDPLHKRRFEFDQQDFSKVPGSPIAYWVNKETTEVFEISKYFKEIAYSFQGMITGNNKKYLRYWFETDFRNIAFHYNNIDTVVAEGKKWIPYNKGGAYRKWYGNNEYVLHWENNGKGLTRARTENREYYLRSGITWNFLSTTDFSARLFEEGFLWDVAGSSIFVTNDQYSLEELLAFMNSKVSKYVLNIYNPTLNFQVENILNLPYIQSEQYKNEIINLTKENVMISKEDWDSSETSWNFTKHPMLLSNTTSLKDALTEWQKVKMNRQQQLKANEQLLNEKFIEIYRLQDVLEPTVSMNEIALTPVNAVEEMKSFISYAIGCSFGRYSLDEQGLIYAGGDFNANRYKSFNVDEDNILPIVSGSYFEDDIVGRFIQFLIVTFGEANLEENLEFVAETIGRKTNETAREALRRYFINEFYKDHVQLYKKRPIYWLFTSGKEKAFNCLIYIHRYDKTTLSRIRTDYLHFVQNRMESEKADLLNIINGESTAKEINQAKKELKNIEKKLEELKTFDEKLHHFADQQIELIIDDGVVHNYNLFNGLVAKI